MNSIQGNITEIQSNDALSLVKVACDTIVLTTIVIDTPETQTCLQIGNLVKLYFKETEVSIAKKENLAISIQNKIPCSILAIKQGILLSEIDLVFGNLLIKSIITTNGCQQLNLQLNDEVFALIKTNEISIAPYD